MQKQFTSTSGWKNTGLDFLYFDGIFSDVYGENSGNNIFSEYLNIFLSNPVSYECENYFNEGDVFIWSPANFLYELSEVPSFSDILFRHADHLIIFGIGIQARHSISEIRLKPETEKFLTDLFDRGAKFISRGAKSSEFLRSIGIDTSFMGCGSILLKNTFGMERLRFKNSYLLDRDFISIANIALSFTGYLEKSKHRLSVYQSLPNYENFLYIAQTEINLYKRLNNIPFNNDHYIQEVENLPPAMVDSLINNNNFLFDLDPIRLALKMAHIDFYISERIHGAILAISNGIPTILISSDLRTLELCELLSIPNVRTEEIMIDESLNINFFIQKYLDQVGSFEKNFPLAQNSLIGFFNDQKIKNIYNS
jgi:polysaccharide pyruvyl transferase WcaK-like protein